MKIHYMIASAAALCLASSAKAAPTITQTFSYSTNTNGNSQVDPVPVLSADHYGLGNLSSVTIQSTLSGSLSYEFYDLSPNTPYATLGHYVYSASVNNLNFSIDGVKSFTGFSDDYGFLYGDVNFSKSYIQLHTDTATLQSFNDGQLLFLQDGFVSYNSIGSNDTTGYYEVATTVTYTYADAAVPEPATWGMMILGFGMVGGTMRYRKRSPKVAFA